MPRLPRLAVQPTDSSSEKFSGALLNAIIFVGIMAGMTFLLVALFYFKCYRIIYGYMTFAVFDIFALITAFIAIEVLQVGCCEMFMYGCRVCKQLAQAKCRHVSSFAWQLGLASYSPRHVADFLEIILHDQINAWRADCFLLPHAGLEHSRGCYLVFNWNLQLLCG
jgi:hypothetical protein